MTTEEKAKAYDEALELARAFYIPTEDKEVNSVLEQIFPKLRESENERIRKWLVDYFGSIKGVVWIHRDITCEKILEWLEKQKKQKPDIEHIQQSWYMEGYQDREHNREPEWIVKTGEGGPRYEENQKYGQPLAKEQKPAEKQDYSGLNDCERAIHRGFLAAGVENVPVGIIKEIAQDCIAHFPWPTKWSEEDEKMYNSALWHIKNSCGNGGKNSGEYEVYNWLKNRVKSLRPSWKPSEEQMNCLCAAVDAAIRKHNESVSGYRPARVLKSLYEDLKKLNDA